MASQFLPLCPSILGLAFSTGHTQRLPASLLPCSCHRNKKYLTSEMHFLLPKEKDSSLLLDFVKERETSSSHKFANIYYHVSSDWVTCSSLSQSLRSVESGINFDWSQPGLGSRAEGEDTSIHTVGWGKRRVRILQREIATWRRGYES